MNIFNKKAQTWKMEFIFGFFIFIIVIAMFFTTINDLTRDDKTLEHIYIEGQTISEVLISEGAPTDWDEDNVIRPGILKEGRKIDPEKTGLLYSISETNHSLLRNAFGVNSYFAVYIIDNEGEIIEFDNKKGAASPTVSIEEDGINFNMETDHIAKVKRIVLYEGNPVRMVVFTWL
ncbi:MAG: hypothetical protein ACOCZQ_03050 [Nanoarchaeota archaeon]